MTWSCNTNETNDVFQMFDWSYKYVAQQLQINYKLKNCKTNKMKKHFLKQNVDVLNSRFKYVSQRLQTSYKREHQTIPWSAKHHLP